MILVPILPFEREIMARLKRGEKTKAVRDYITANPKATPKEIVAGLATTGMKIKLGLANSLKYGKKKRSQRKSSTVASAARRASTTNGAVTVEQLLDVKRLADSLGGVEHVRSALDTLDQLR
jgi:hypothetical protein